MVDKRLLAWVRGVVSSTTRRPSQLRVREMSTGLRSVAARGLIAFGAACLAWYGAGVYTRVEFQRQQNAALELALARDSREAAPARIPRQGMIGRLEIPRVRLSTMVVEGDDDETLRRAAGHLPDTALPWERGNSAVAGHRDTFFRSLKKVRAGDEIHFTSPYGRFVYRVRDARVTGPDDLRVLASRGRAELTLLTCYPFAYAGSAPNRYVVRADLVSVTRRASL